MTNRNTQSTETKNITFRTYALYEDAVQRAAVKADKNLSDYCRDIIVAWAYSDLGERMPALPSISRGRYSSLETQAAKLTGQTPEAFMRAAAREVAATLLSSAQSGERLKVVRHGR